MSCVHCENKIRRTLEGTDGIINAKVSYSKGTAEITYDETLISTEEIKKIIERLGYGIGRDGKTDVSKILGVSIIFFALYMIMTRLGVFNIFNFFPQASETTGYGMLFVIGLLTSMHCVAMCGGINLSQCVPCVTKGNESRLSALAPGFLYNTGRVISYTAVGAAAGTLGSVIGFSGAFSGIVQLAAGVFMVIMGLNMLNIFPWLKKLTPRMPRIIASKIISRKTSKSPFFIGLLNGLMPCGPLQAMQLYALSTGSALKGAFSMLLFGLGTFPLMFGLGAASSFLNRKFSRGMMTASAVLVIVLGVSMFSGGMSLSGISFSFGKNNTANLATIDGDIQTVTFNLSSGRYEPITVG